MTRNATYRDGFPSDGHSVKRTLRPVGRAHTTTTTEADMTTSTDTRYTVVTCNGDYGDYGTYTADASGIGEIAQRAYSTAEDLDRWVVAIVETDRFGDVLLATGVAELSEA